MWLSLSLRECLTVDYQIDPVRLYATYFQGDESQGLAPDLEAKEIWLRFLPASRIIGCGCKDNFWYDLLLHESLV